MLNQGRFATAIAVFVALLWISVPALAQYPDRTVRILAVQAPGASVDSLARLVANRLQAKWKQNVIVENRVGADGTIAAEMVATAPPDGYTLLFTFNAFTVSPNYIPLKYDPLTSLVPINLVASTPTAIAVNPTALPAVKSIPELVAFARANPGKLSFGSGGTGSPVFLHMALFMNMTQTDMVHVAYRGAAPALVDLLRGELHLGFNSLSSLQPHMEKGTIRVLGVSTKERVAMMPNVPTIASELKTPFDEMAWNGVFAPAGTPKEIIVKINADIEEAMATPETQKILSEGGFVRFRNTPEDYAAFIKNDLAKWAALWKTIQGKAVIQR